MAYIDIKRILNQVKVEDDHIILNESIVIQKYGVNIYIRQINFFYEWKKFALSLGGFLAYYMGICETAGVAGNLKEIKEFRKNIRLVLSNDRIGKKALKYLLKILKLFGLKGWWIKRHFSIDDYIEVFLYAYLYNILGVKKNLKNVLALISKVQSG